MLILLSLVKAKRRSIVTSEIRLFTREAVKKAKDVVKNPDESADPVRGGGFAEWVMLALHALRIELGKSYRQTIDLLSEMPGVLDELGLTRLPHFTALRNSLATIPIGHWRAFFGRSAEKRSGHAAIDSTGFDRDQPSRYYAQRAHYRVRSLKVTALVDVKTLYVFESTARRRRNTTRRSGRKSPGAGLRQQAEH